MLFLIAFAPAIIVLFDCLEDVTAWGLVVEKQTILDGECSILIPVLSVL